MATSPGAADELTREQVEVLLGAAGAAPSMHNTQPWRFEVNGHVVNIYLDRSRALPAEDPDGRAMRIAVGAAVFNLRVAAAHLGMDSWYGLAPYADDTDLMARVVIVPSQAAVPALALLYDQIPRRHTDRSPARPVDISADVRIDLQRVAYVEGAELTWLPGATIDAALWLTVGGDLRADFDAGRIAERRRWVGGRRTADGVPQAAFGPRPASYPPVVRDLGATARDRRRPAAPFERTPALALLTTQTDTVRAQVTAGMALQRVLLTASRRGLSASFLNQPLEYEDLRTHVQELTELPGHAQMLIRFVPSRRGYAATPRRPVSDLITGSAEPGEHPGVHSEEVETP